MKKNHSFSQRGFSAVEGNPANMKMQSSKANATEDHRAVCVDSAGKHLYPKLEFRLKISPELFYFKAQHLLKMCLHKSQ